MAIDGPAGAGKSTVAHQLSERLGFEFLDTGAMYRCVTLALLRNGVDIESEQEVAKLLESIEIELQGTTVRLNGEDVSQEIRTPKIAGMIGTVADNLQVRKVLSNLQRRWAEGKKVVTEGRDQGTEVFYDSPCKIFLVASPEERARRRVKDLASRGIDMEYADVLQQQNQRDADDIARPVGALRKADDAAEICTDGVRLPEIVDRLEAMARALLPTNMAEPLNTLSKSENSP